MTGMLRPSLKRDLATAFLWALIIALIMLAPGVFTRTIEFVYTAF
jgi:hypothetical protein